MWPAREMEPLMAAGAAADCSSAALSARSRHVAGAVAEAAARRARHAAGGGRCSPGQQRGVRGLWPARNMAPLTAAGVAA